MINQGSNVPDKTIAIFLDQESGFFINDKRDRVFNVVSKSPKKRDWFTPDFYRCLPLTIGNQQGFIIKSEFDFSFIWDGGDGVDSIRFFFNENEQELNKKYPRISTHFGSGIITINPPFALRTPPGVNLITINPPNYIVPNITVMTGVIETDNLRRNFTFNLKVQTPNIKTDIPAGSPLAGFIPIPRYFSDKFELKYAEDIFTENEIIEEDQANLDANTHRKYIEPYLKNNVSRDYFIGQDIYKNKFLDHQNP